MMLSAQAITEEDIILGLSAGADEYLIKPMPSSVLVAHLKRLARRARAEVVAETTSPPR